MEQVKYEIGKRVTVISTPAPKFEKYAGKSGVVTEHFTVDANDLEVKKSLGLSGDGSSYYIVNIDGIDVDGIPEEALQL